MLVPILLLSLLQLSGSIKWAGPELQAQDDAKYGFVNITGYFIIGAMFPIHNLIGGGKCGNLLNDQDGIQNLEALLYSLKKANTDILGDINVSLGVLAVDTCYSDTVALERALEFVKLQQDGTELNTRAWVCGDGTTPRFISSGKLIGVIGAATSSVSIQLASFLRLFKLPQISYASTSPELSDVKRYDYFMRTVPSDVHQAHAIVEILRKLEWTYVVGIYEDTSYGVLGFAEVTKQAEVKGICIAAEFKVKRYFETEEDKVTELYDIINELDQFNNTEGQIVVILYTSQGIVTSLFEMIKARGDYGKFLWIGSDAWSGRTVKSSVQNVAESSLTIQPEVRKIQEFEDYFKSLKPALHLENPWFKEYWEQIFNCTFSDQSNFRSNPRIRKYDVICTGNETIDEASGTYISNYNTYSTMDAVYVFAYALKALHADRCQGRPGVCEELKNITGHILLEYLKNVTFTDPDGVYFQFFGTDGPAYYSIMKYTFKGGAYRWQQVGVFKDYQNDSDHFNWTDDSVLNSNKPSMCSAPCQTGEAKSKRNKCCWSCSPCAFYQFLRPSEELCDDCPSGELPNKTRTGCDPIPEVAMSYSNVWAIISVLIASCGIVVTILVGVIFYRYRDTPIIMAAGKELSYVLLVGIFFSYLSSFVFVGYPTGFTCGATRLLLGLCYTLCYAAILVKTNRIYRVFNINTKKPKRVRFTSARSQLLIVLGIVLVELAALVAWLVFDPPKASHIYPSKTDNVHVCADSTDFSYLGALVYPFILMVICIVYAVRTRKTPDGFNETRFIAFGSYSFCLTWIAFIPIYFTVSDNTVRIVCLCWASSVNATVTLITLFITKTYIAILRPEKNTKENVMARNKRRTQSYDTIDLNNLSNLSKIASAVSTWNSSYESGTPPSPMRSKFGNKLSVAVISTNNISDISSRSSASPFERTSPYERPKLRRRATVGDVLDTDDFASEVVSNVTDATDIPQTSDKTDDISPNSENVPKSDIVAKSLTLQNGISPRMAQRRTFKAKRKTFSHRPKSADPYIVPNIVDVVPNIVVTDSNSEEIVSEKL